METGEEERGGKRKWKGGGSERDAALHAKETRPHLLRGGGDLSHAFPIQGSWAKRSVRFFNVFILSR